jgi:3-oxoacyl-[acyl-carrier protein] reductase
LVAGIQAAGGTAIAVQANVTDEQQVKTLVEETVAAFGKIDILVSNAAIGFPYKTFAQMTWDEFSPKLNNELKAAFELTKAVVPYMSEQKYGRIIYVASGLAKNPSQGFIAHGTAKDVAGAIAFFCQRRSRFYDRDIRSCQRRIGNGLIDL